MSLLQKSKNCNTSWTSAILTALLAPVAASFWLVIGYSYFIAINDLCPSDNKNIDRADMTCDWTVFAGVGTISWFFGFLATFLLIWPLRFALSRLSIFNAEGHVLVGFVIGFVSICPFTNLYGGLSAGIYGAVLGFTGWLICRDTKA